MERKSQNCWWLGINNVLMPDGRPRVVIYPQIESFLRGEQETFRWPRRGNNRSCYGAMAAGDKVVLWTGHNAQGISPWGVVGFAEIASIDSPLGNYITLASDATPSRPLVPYRQGAPKGPGSRTPESDFLWRVFGADFRPLDDVFTWLGYHQTERHSIITAYPVDNDCYAALRDRLLMKAA